MTDHSEAREILERIVGRKAVTDGPWTPSTGNTMNAIDVYIGKRDCNGELFPRWRTVAIVNQTLDAGADYDAVNENREANMAHIVDCNPVNMRAIAALVADLDAKIVILKAHVETLRKRHTGSSAALGGNDG